MYVAYDGGFPLNPLSSNTPGDGGADSQKVPVLFIANSGAKPFTESSRVFKLMIGSEPKTSDASIGGLV